MFKKVLFYAGEYRRVTYASVAAMLAGIIFSVIPFLFVYQLISPLLSRGTVSVQDVVIKAAAIGICELLYAMPQVNIKIESPETMLATEPLIQTEKGFEESGHFVSFENVHFSYGKDEVLHDISFEVPEGTMTALVGESGSGKSTLAKLLVHFYDVGDGVVRSGGQDVRDMSIEALLTVPQYIGILLFIFELYGPVKALYGQSARLTVMSSCMDRMEEVFAECELPNTGCGTLPVSGRVPTAKR